MEYPERKYCIYCRTNRRVKWIYAEYGGRYETVEQAIQKAKDHYHEKAEYIVEDMDGNLVATGFLND